MKKSTHFVIDLSHEDGAEETVREINVWMNQNIGRDRFFAVYHPDLKRMNIHIPSDRDVFLTKLRWSDIMRPYI